MFKFNFSNDNNNKKNNVVNQSDCIWSESQQIDPSSISVNHNLKTNLLKIGDFVIKYVVCEQVIESLRSTEAATNSVLNADQNHSDLVPSVYEGGLKIWECTFDLLSFLKDIHLQFQDKHVLDLGCGVGLLGIYTGLNGARVTFQDYPRQGRKRCTNSIDERFLKQAPLRNVTILKNALVAVYNLLVSARTIRRCLNKFGLDVGETFAHQRNASQNLKRNVEVINGVTIPNVRLNAVNEASCSFYSGDWGSFLEFMNDERKFDYILTSETIYNTENYLKLTNIFRSLLKQDGIIYLAAKSYYFGVGGSLSHFLNELNPKNIIYKTVWECNNGIKRAIIEIKLN